MQRVAACDNSWQATAAAAAAAGKQLAVAKLKGKQIAKCDKK